MIKISAEIMIFEAPTWDLPGDFGLSWSLLKSVVELLESEDTDAEDFYVGMVFNGMIGDLSTNWIPVKSELFGKIHILFVAKKTKEQVKHCKIRPFNG